MKANKLLIVIGFLFFISSNQSLAQNTESVLLETFLHTLEEQFDVVFTYADKNIQGIHVTILNERETLDEYLLELEELTNLEFKKIDSRYIAVQPKSNNIKISGFVVDKYTNEKIAGAIISYGDDYTLSDENGFFSINYNPAIDTDLLIRYTGYKPLQPEKALLNNDSSIYQLIPDVQVLDEIVINYIARGIDKLSDGSVRMNVQNIEVLPGLTEPDVLHTVQVLPGIQSINESVADINTRGGTNDQSLVLWDGVKMYQTGHFFGLISAFNSHLINQTRIIKSGANATFDEGVSGIIDMHEQDYLSNDFEFSTGANMISSDFVMKLPVSKKISFILGARHSINNIVKTPTYKSYYNRAFEHTEVSLNQEGDNSTIDKFHDFSFYDLSFKLLYDLNERNKIRLSFLDIDNTIKYEESVLLQDILQTKESFLSQSSILSNLRFIHSWNEKNVTELSAYVSNYNLDSSNFSESDNELHIQENEVIDWGIKLDFKNNINQKILLSNGYQFKEIGIRNLDNIRNPGYFRDAKDVLRIHSVYTEAEIKNLFERVYLRISLRNNYFSEFNKFSFEPRLVFNYKFSNSLSFEASAEKKSQHTTQLIDFQTDFLGVEKRRWVLSNNGSIPLINSKQVSLGIQYDKDNFLVSLEAYRKNINGIISPSQGFQNQYQSVYSTGEYKTHGLELLINKHFRQYNLWINYTLAENNYYFEEFTPSSFPNNLDIRHTLSAGCTYTLNQFELSGGVNFRTGKPYTKPTSESLDSSNEIVYEEPNSSRLDNYLRVDISAKYKFSLPNLKGEFGLSIWNILNRENVINIYYHKNENNKLEKVTLNALQLTPNINLRINF